ncbi:glucose 1-dehydrogenase [Brevibacillus humidisoli]|uniref:SDR family NAD(P)-dependent oxidoreductase n=1 Tax=Brevibacillus humidisoli TaxID=2895522 RepID=UPI001E2CB1F4|nr:glucose 1-dehydrogenase [Brevibacillus humidisoli]UFJ41392.1 glucose 1-dehydrogenase [Brevibacillus humidisoli]
MRLKGKVALITGAGSGIGRSTALLFASQGAKVIVNDISDAQGSDTVAEIVRQGGEGLFLKGDVTKAEEVEAIARRAIERYRQIDVLFNNAGISGVGAVHETAEDLWDRVVNVNIKGVFLVSKAVLPHMMARRTGSIINMSSCIAEIGLQRRAVYSASKGAVLALTKSMQVDYATYNIRVNALLPGTILTPFVEEYLRKSYDNPEEAMESLKQRQLSGDLGRPEDVAQAALYLASDESRFMMGSPLYIDGGATFGKMA